MKRTTFRPGGRTRAAFSSAMAALTLAVVCASVATAFAVLAPDAYEPDDTYTAAATIAVATPQVHTLFPAADYDWVTFVPTVDQPYDIRTSSAGGVDVDTLITLYVDDGAGGITYVTENDDFLGPYSRIAWTPSTDATAYVEITHVDTPGGGGDPGDYEVAVYDLVPGIAGTVTEQGSGNPLSGIDVTAYHYEAGIWFEDAYAQSGASGAYGLTDLGTGSYAVGFVDPSGVDGYHVPEFYDDVSGIDDATLVATTEFSTVSGVDAALTRLGYLAGTVRAEATGLPLAGMRVTAYAKPGSSWISVATTSTGTDGTYRVESLTTGTYRLRFSDPAAVPGSRTFYVSQYYDEVLDLAGAHDIELTASGFVEGLDADLGRARVARLSGPDRYTTAVRIARYAFDPDGDKSWPGVEHVIIASGEDRAAADPLAASGLCWAYDAPLFLVSRSSTSAQVKDAIVEIVKARGSVEIHVVGGTASVPDARIANIKAAAGPYGLVTAERLLSGGNRYDLARAIAVRMKQVAALTGRSLPGTVLIANGADPAKFFDALALSPIATDMGAPILLVAKDSVPAATTAALKTLAPTRVIVGGGPATVSAAVKTAVGATGPDDRWYGATRYSTASTIASKAISAGWLSPGVVGLAAKLPDGMTGGAMAGHLGGVLLLTPKSPLAAESAAVLTSHRLGVEQCLLLGGPASIAETVVESAAARLR
ncbi:MAG: cell wall-binding repeat-containing protein [Actinomycetota bacterium]|nr:cell wall-binding repeat-containing protein [Actinomycetota bacterium]